MAIYLQELRFALRSLAKRPGFSLAIILILGLGLGAATAVFDLINLLAWRKLPVERPDELVRIFTASQRGFVGPYNSTSYRDYVDYRDANQSFSSLAAHVELDLHLDTGEAIEPARGTAVSGNFFETLRLGLTAGRPLTVEDDRSGSSPAMVITHHLWQRLGKAPDVLGTTMTAGGMVFTVVGIGPVGFTSTIAGMRTDFLFPVAALPRMLGEEGTVYLQDRQRARMYMTGRLRSGVSRAAARAELATLAQRIDAEHPRSETEHRQLTLTAATIAHPVDLHRLLPSLRLFAAAVALLLIITCANVAHLLLARAASRRVEMGIRQSLGASRWRLVRQLLTESILLALGGGVCGLVLAYWARAFLVAFASSELAGEMRFDFRVLGASFAVCLAATLLFGLVPALTASRVNLVGALKGDASGSRRRRFSAGQLLSAAQVALCVVLLVAGSLLGRSLWNRLTTDLGFDDDNLLIAGVALPGRYSSDEGPAFVRQLRQRVAALPSVEQAGLALLVPPILFDISLPVHLPEDPDNARSSRINFVDGHYFQTLGIALEQGRLFDTRDSDSGRPVVVVNRLLAEELWPGENPLGRTIRSISTRPIDPGPDYEVVGVVRSVSQHRSSHGGEPVLYFSAAQRFRRQFKLVMRSSAEASMVFDSLRDLLQEVDPGLRLSSTETGETNRRAAFTFERIQAQAVGACATLGLLLAVLGIFGVLSYAVSLQVREFGIRMALGARRQDVLWQVVGQGMLLALLGIGVGLVGTFFASRFLENLLFGVTTGNIGVLTAVVVTVMVAAFGAAYLPAHRASRLDPIAALRHE